MAEGVNFVSFDELLGESDYLTLHCPLTPQTAKIFNAEAFSKMKKKPDEFASLAPQNVYKWLGKLLTY